MAPTKLTEADKTSILSMYRQPQETTSTLAERYGVSNSTISRLLKASLPKDEYSVLIQQKRGSTDKTVVVPAAVPKVDAPPPKAKPRSKKPAEPKPAVVTTTEDEASAEEASIEEASTEEALTPTVDEAPASPAKPTRKRRSSSAKAAPTQSGAEPVEPVEADSTDLPEPAQLSLPDPDEAPEKPARPVLKSAQAAPAAAGGDIDDDDWDDDDPVLGDDYEDDDDSDDDDDDDEAYSWDGGDKAATPHLETLEISPLTADVLPPLCYVVVERTSSELVVLPLRTFAELGQIPEAEGDSRTLPVFENHNVARRFSRRNQRVVKVPDGTLLQTTSPYLQAKGITRLFIDGQVFSIGQDPVADPVTPTIED